MKRGMCTGGRGFRSAMSLMATVLSVLSALSIGSAATVLTAPSAAAAAPQATAPAPGNSPGWSRDFVDDFRGPLNTSVWSRYETSYNQTGMLSEWDRANVCTRSGSLVIRTYNAGGRDWRAGGVSSGPGFAAAQGKWAMRARFDRAYGIGYAFLLYPRGGSWPPEVDFAEGTAGGPRVMSTLHWSSANLKDSRFKYGLDMSQWHTYGVVLSNNKVEFTVDGVVWDTIHNAGSPRIRMWVGFQSAAKAPLPNAIGEVVNSRTPLDSNIYIDWVAHWKAV